MMTGIRAVSGGDSSLVAAFFRSVYESRHGVGSSSEIEMLQRTVASFFGDDEALTVWVSEVSGAVQGVAAVRHSVGSGPCELVTIQTRDSVQGRGTAQTLLRHVVKSCAERAGTVLETSVPMSDVRARGFLRREGFVATTEDLQGRVPGGDVAITYRLDVVEALALAERVASHDQAGRDAQ